MLRTTRLVSILPPPQILARNAFTRPTLASGAISIAFTGLRLSSRPQLLFQSSSPLAARRAYSVQNPTATNPTSIPNQAGPSSSSSSGPDPSPEPEPTSAYARFKLLAKKYGWYAFGMYWILSTIDFTLSFVLVHSLGAERIEPLLASSLRTYRTWRHGEEETRKLEEEDIKRRAEVKKETEGKKGGYWGSRMFWAEVLLAYTIHKTALLPIRAGLTAAWTPKVVHWLRARGWAGKVSPWSRV
jgi:hypothetical protein